MRIGIDIGNVIIGGVGDDTQFFTDDFMNTPALEGAWESIKALCDKHELHIISKCGPTTESKSIQWLSYYAYFWLIAPHNIHFVRKRELKAPMAQALQLDVFIDDRQDVLDFMEGIVDNRILFTSWEQTNKELEQLGAFQG